MTGASGFRSRRSLRRTGGSDERRWGCAGFVPCGQRRRCFDRGAVVACDACWSRDMRSHTRGETVTLTPSQVTCKDGDGERHGGGVGHGYDADGDGERRDGRWQLSISIAPSASDAAGNRSAAAGPSAASGGQHAANGHNRPSLFVGDGRGSGDLHGLLRRQRSGFHSRRRCDAEQDGHRGRLLVVTAREAVRGR